ncbi:MAG: hypothetical protein U0W24_16280 [Bacteroidales bacterium]
MKRNIIYLLGGLLLLFTACDPITDDNAIGDLVPQTDFKYSITQDPTNDYIVYVKNETPEVLFKWNSGWETSYQQNDTMIIPIAGNAPIKITAVTAGGLVDFQVDLTVNDQKPDAFSEPYWAQLTNLGDGKTWVWDNTKSAVWGNGGYKGCNAPCWWQVSYADMAGQEAQNDEMELKLSGGYQLTLTAQKYPSAGTTIGSFVLDMSSTIGTWSIGKLKTQEVIIPKGVNVNNNNMPFYEYDIMTLNENEFVLSAPEGGAGAGDWSTAWFWQFKPKAGK